MLITSHLKTYTVTFTDKYSFINDLAGRRNLFVLIDAKVYRLYNDRLGGLLTHPHMIFRSLERNKTIQKALVLSEAIMALQVRRNALLVSIGGGIVQDVSGFAASILYRGIPWIFVPTTLLAQSDSCIGSKTSLNYSGNKNVFGTFYPPDRVYIEADFLPTLSRKDFLSGVGEIAKLAITSGEAGIREFEHDQGSVLKADAGVIQKWIARSLELKKRYIEQDEFDFGVRKLLNYGHTFGHALEKTSGYAIPHGQAVSIGMCIANMISEQRGWISAELNARLRTIILPLVEAGLCAGYFQDGYIDSIRKDKKRSNDLLPGILLSTVSGEFALKEVNDVREVEVSRAVASTLSCFSLLD